MTCCLLPACSLTEVHCVTLKHKALGSSYDLWIQLLREIVPISMRHTPLCFLCLCMSVCPLISQLNARVINVYFLTAECKHRVYFLMFDPCQSRALSFHNPLASQRPLWYCSSTHSKQAASCPPTLSRPGWTTSSHMS